MDAQDGCYLVFSGTSHPELAKEIAHSLNVSLGRVKIDRFPDGEIGVQILENVRDRDVFIVQTIAMRPNDYLMELLIMIDALRRASARSITAVLPYYGYCRQDRKDKPRVPITAKLVANMLASAGVTRVVTMDLHAGQVQGFFDIPVDNLYARPLMVDAIKELGLSDLMVVVPDIGSVKLGRSFANQLDVEMAIVDKNRIDAHRTEVTTLIGSVKGKNVLLADDMCSTGGTLVSAAQACLKEGAQKIVAVFTHGLLVGNAVKKIEDSPIELVLMSNTIPLTVELSKKFRQVSVAPHFAYALRCILSKESISSLYNF